MKAVAPEEFDNPARIADAQLNDFERRQRQFAFEIGKQVGTIVERKPILGEVPTEFYEGEWHFPKADGPEPWAVITYIDEPSPETGDVGWCWWARGSMGAAPSYEAARDAAVAEIQRRMDDRMAVL